MIIRTSVFVFLFLLGSTLGGQSLKERQIELMQGYWEGAFIKGNAYQQFDIRFYKRDDKLLSLQVIEEWHPIFGEFELPVEIDSIGNITFNTGYGKAKMLLDTNYLEITGFIENTNPSINVHFKKVPRPPVSDYTVEEVIINNGEVNLFGHLHLPKHSVAKSAIILVGGRGCYAGSTKYDLYAKVLREYGLAVLVFNKRGTGKSTGNCDQATIKDLASDVVACKKFLVNRSEGFLKIGVLGSSAGGWVMVKAQEIAKTSFDFLISVVGPSTSVKEQQFQSMEYGLEFYNLPEPARTSLRAYTDLMFNASGGQKEFDQFQQLLQLADQQGWKTLLDDTDIPGSPEEINQLWVRRHNYDPQKGLSEFNNPFLAIYGKRDWIVPYKENIERLNELFNKDRQKLLTTVVAFDAEHGTETTEKYVSLGQKSTYWHFFRISPQVLIEMIDFLEKHGIID